MRCGPETLIPIELGDGKHEGLCASVQEGADDGRGDEGIL